MEAEASPEIIEAEEADMEEASIELPSQHPEPPAATTPLHFLMRWM